MDRLRILKPAQLLAWAEDLKCVIRLRERRDALPNQYGAAFLPMVVDWRRSHVDGDTPNVILRNINYGGNVLERTNQFHSVRVPLDGLDFAEFTLVPLIRGRTNTNVQHGHLRFVFREDARPVLLSMEDSQTGSDPCLDDLVFSWEPWHAIGVKFDFIKALDDRFGLTMRGYAGAQRYLEDALAGLPWMSYRLRMPAGVDGLKELFKICVAIGDGAARHSIARILDEHGEAWLQEMSQADETKPDDEVIAEVRQHWEELRARIDVSQSPGIDVRNLLEDHQSYNTLVRSCASLARYTVLLTAHRLVEQGLGDGLSSEKLPPAVLGEPEPWMQGAAQADLLGILARAPSALRFLLAHPTTRPKLIPKELDEAGLIERRNGKPWLVRYDKNHTRPYGATGANRDLN